MLRIPSLILSVAFGLMAGTAEAQLLNGGFENTTEVDSFRLPVDWSVNSYFGAGAVDAGHTGDHALAVWHWYWYGPGIASNGASTLEGQEGTPFTGTPSALTGFYKRTVGVLEQEQSSNDSGLVSVLLTRWNTDLLRRDTVAFGQRSFGGAEAWSPFTIGLGYLLTGPPDTLVVRVLSGIDCFCGIGTSGTCCYLYLDDLAVETGNGISTPLFDTYGAELIGIGGGLTEVRVHDRGPLPLLLHVYDGLGRLVVQAVVRDDRERLRIPVGDGLLYYRFMEGTAIVGCGKIAAY